MVLDTVKTLHLALLWTMIDHVLQGTHVNDPNVTDSLKEDAERLAAELAKKVFELDRRRRSIRDELERLDKLHSWLNAQRHLAKSIVDRMSY